MKKKTINAKAPGIGIGGEVKYILYDQEEDGSLTLVEERDWTSNTITDLGLITFSTAWHLYMSIGSDGSATDPADPTLGTFLDSSNTLVSGSGDYGNEGSPNYEFWIITGKRFAAGVGTGTVEEMGFGTANDGTDLFARHVVSPAVPKAANQVLDVFYKGIYWPELTPVSDTTLIGGVNYDTETSFYNVDVTQPFAFTAYTGNTSAGGWRAYTGTAATSTANTPNGDQATTSTSAYNGSTGSGYRNVGRKSNLDDHNTSTGFIRTATGKTSFLSLIQTQFTATDGPDIGDGIPKSVKQELTLNWQLTWDRH